MSQASLARRWFDSFLVAAQQHERRDELIRAAGRVSMGSWVRETTAVAESACRSFGWIVMHRHGDAQILPIRRDEVLGIDVAAFGSGGSRRWPLPEAVIEFSTSGADSTVAYYAWKLLLLLAPLRVVFAYRRSAADETALVGHLEAEVVRPIGIVDGELLLIVGARAAPEAYPRSFFRSWVFDAATGRFAGTR